MKKILHKTLALCAFFVVCQLCGIMLYYNVSLATSAHGHLIRECAEMLKYSFVSLAIISASGAIFCKVEKENT